jgi:hypothetical protein
VRTVVGAAQRWDLIRHFSHDTLFSGEASDSQPTGISFSIVRSQIPGTAPGGNDGATIREEAMKTGSDPLNRGTASGGRA